MQSCIAPTTHTKSSAVSANPAASDDTPEGRAKNRRIEIVLNGDGT
jgi:flagellar motor protein MotB